MQRLLCSSECLYELYDAALLLKQLGYEVVLATSPGRAIAPLSREQVDAVVFSALRNGLKSVPAASLKFIKPDIPVIAIAHEYDSLHAPRSGVDLVIHDANDLQRRLAEIFSTIDS